jgi:hypothetical protein
MQFRHDFSTTEGNDIKKRVKDKNPKRGITISQAEIKELDIWSELKHYNKNSIFSKQVAEKLCFDVDSTVVSKINFLSPDEYFSLLFSSINKEVLTEKLNEGKTSLHIPFTQLVKLPLPNKLEYVMKRIGILTYGNLKKLMKDLGSADVSDKDLVETVLKFSRFLKNGSLILKTEVRYDSNRDNEIALKRNYLINLLQNNPDGVAKADIKFLDKRELDTMLTEFTHSSSGKVFLRESNIDNTEVINTLRSYYDKDIQFWDSISFKKNPGTNTIINVHNSDQKGVNTDAVKEIIVKAFTRSGIISYNNLMGFVKKEYNSPTEDKVIGDSINKLCYVINNTCYIRDVGDQEMNDVRKHLFDFFGKSKSGKKAQIKEYLSSVGMTITETLLNKILKSVAVNDKNVYTLKYEN